MKKTKEELKEFIISYFPIIISLIISVILKIYFLKCGVYRYEIFHFSLLFEILIPSMITFMGFSITIITVFIGFEKGHILLESIKNDRFKKQFNRYILLPIFSALIIIVISFTSIIVIKDSNTININAFIILLFFIIYFILGILRLFLLLFFSFSANISNEKDNQVESDVNDLDIDSD